MISSESKTYRATLVTIVKKYWRLKQRFYTSTTSQTVHLLTLLTLPLLTIASNSPMQPHFKGSCGTCHCALRHSLLHFHSNFLRALSRHPFQGIENRQRYRHKNPFVDRGAAHPRRCSFMRPRPESAYQGFLSFRQSFRHITDTKKPCVLVLTRCHMLLRANIDSHAYTMVLYVWLSVST